MRKPLFWAAALSIFLLLPTVPAAAREMGGVIRGTVTNGTTKKPVANLEVVLSKGNTETGEGEEGVESTRTNDRGRFEFYAIDESPWMYDVYVEYEGAPYYSPGITVGGGKTEKANLTVFDSTDSSKDVAVSEWIVYLDPDQSGLAVEQSLTYQNTGDRSYIGPKMEGSGQRIATTLPVATTAIPDSVDTVGLFEGCCGGVVGDSFGHTAPIPPGGTLGTMRYVSSTPASLVFPVTLPTASVKVLVAPGVDISGISELTPAGSESLQSGGQTPAPVTYTSYTAANLTPGASLGLTASIGGGDGVPSALIIVLAIAGLVALLLIIVKLRGPRAPTRPASKGSRKTPASKSRAASHKQAKPKKPSPSELHPPEPVGSDLLIAEIATLDLSYEQGLIKKDEYEQLRAARKAELMGRGGDE